jgi:hypothetical protein
MVCRDKSLFSDLSLEECSGIIKSHRRTHNVVSAIVVASVFLFSASTAFSEPAQQNQEPETSLSIPIDSRTLCAELARVGELCTKGSNGRTCARSWAKENAQQFMLATQNITPDSPDWNFVVDAFDRSCRQGCSQKLNKEYIRSPNEFCSRLGVKVGPPKNRLSSTIRAK